ncbi:MAG TPA: hypothetical protein VMP67_04455 [Candidatus Limnocylindria bacterium]|nr:hypothetical protein [Candidatus Limnocylindria bacterium]
MRLRLRLVVALALLAGCAGEAPASPLAPSATPSPAVSQSPAGSPTAIPGLPTPAGLPTPSPAPSPAPTAALSPAPEREAYSVNLYRDGAFVSEYTDYYCLPAAMQVMINIMSDAPPDTTRETQDRLYELAAELDGVDLPPRVRDIEPEGWALGLEAEGYGRWAVRAEESREDAIRLGARQLRLTGKPVGLLTWRGAHSWVMSGFEATADPLHFDDFEVTGVWIQDVWWPRISRIWGESNPPNTLVPVEDLPEDYRRYRRPYGEFPDKDGRFVLVIPIEGESRDSGESG